MSALNNFHTIVASSAAAAVLVGLLESPAAAAVANTAISVQGSPSGYPAGAVIFGTATLGLGNSPTGTMTFKMYSPLDPACAGTPSLVTDVAVAGNGYYQSSYVVANLAGTYRWTVRYNGDANNNPTATTACSDPAGEVQMGKRTPTLRSTASNAAGVVTNAAVLGSSSGPSGATGTVTFMLYGPDNMMCGGAPVFTSSKGVSGNATYPSDSFRPTAPGTYQWTVRYSGDANNNGASTMCSDPANAVTVSGSVAGTSVTAPTSIRPYEQMTVTWGNIASPTSGDWLALYAAGASDGNVVLWRYTGGAATGSLSVLVPWGTKLGTYEVRLFANNSAQRLDVSDPITIW